MYIKYIKYYIYYKYINIYMSLKYYYIIIKKKILRKSNHLYKLLLNLNKSILFIVMYDQ